MDLQKTFAFCPNHPKKVPFFRPHLPKKTVWCFLIAPPPHGAKRGLFHGWLSWNRYCVFALQNSKYSSRKKKRIMLFFYFLGHISLFTGSLFLFPNCQSKIIYCNAAEVNVGPCTPEMKQDIKVQIKSTLNYKPETNVEISCIGKLYKLHSAL